LKGCSEVDESVSINGKWAVARRANDGWCYTPESSSEGLLIG